MNFTPAVVGTALLALVALVATPDPARPRQDTRQDSGHDEHETELAACMERLEQALKAVRRNLKEESTRPEALRELLELEKATLESRGYVPELIAEVPEAERPTFVTNYRRMLIDMSRAELDLESAILDGDAAAMQTALDAVRAFEDRGHERFTDDER